MKATFKADLLETCKGVMRRRIELLSFSMDEIREAMDSETKSTVGDKHETARARLQREHEGLAWQRDEAKGQYRELERIDLKRKYNEIATGCVIETDKAIFFITIPVGKVEQDSLPVYVISAQSPIGKAMYGLKKNQSFQFKNAEYRILDLQ